MTFYYHAIIVP